MQETPVQFRGQEDPLEKQWAIHFRILGLPWWLSGKEFVCNGRRHRRHGFDPGDGKIHWRKDRLPTPVFLGFPCGSAGEESAFNAGDLGSIPGLGRSPGEGKGYPLQYFGLENSMDCIIHGVAESNTTERLSLSRQTLVCELGPCLPFPLLWFPQSWP